MGVSRGYNSKMLLPDSIFAILGAMDQIGGFADRRDIVDVSGYSPCYFAFSRPRLTELGWLESPRRGAYAITERGKIVLAIETGRRTKDRARTFRLKKQSFRSFTKGTPKDYRYLARQQQIAAGQSASPYLGT